MRFQSEKALFAQLQDWNEDYGEYAARLWQKGVRTYTQLANAPNSFYTTVGVDSELHIHDIKALASGRFADSSNQESKHQQEQATKAAVAAAVVAEAAAAQAAAAHREVSALKRQGCSVTNYASIGKELLAAPVRVRSDMLPQQYTPLHDVVDSDFINQWTSIQNEDGVQVLAKRLFQAVRKEQSGSVQTRFVLDTHSRGFYTIPSAKVDLALSASKEAFWTTLESCTELKYKLSPESDCTSAVGQVDVRAKDMFHAQPNRQFIIQCILGSDAVELWRFDESGSLPYSSGRQPLEWKSESPGYQLLMSYLRATAHDLGYISSVPLQDLTVKLLHGQTVSLKNCTPIADIPNRRLVYKASYDNQDAPVVVKFGVKTQIDYELEIMQHPQLAGPGMPQVLAVGEVSNFSPELQMHVGTLSNYYVMEPFGVHISKDHPPWLKLSALLDVCDVLQRLTERNYLHRDISPDNIVIAQVGGEWRGFLLDFHVAALQDAQTSTQLAGKVHYWALKLHAAKRAQEGKQAPKVTDRHTQQTDVESLFYTLLEWASDGLPWRHVMQEAQVHLRKFYVMFDPAAWQRVLERCDQQLQPVLSSLHMQIFGQSAASYSEHSVSFEQVCTIVQPVYHQMAEHYMMLDNECVSSQPDCGL